MLKLILLNMIFVLAMGTYQLAYEGDRLVDIPVPPNSSGHADFTSEEGEQQAKEYEENKEKNSVEKQEEIENDIEKKEEKQQARNKVAIAGIVGVLLIFGVSMGVKIYRKKSKKSWIIE